MMNTRALLLSWIGLSVSYTASLALFQRVEISKELKFQGAALTNQVSQRADQHDAHLTGLSALAISEREPNSALFLEVVAAIRQYYPRVRAVDLVSLDDETDVISTRDEVQSASALYSAIHAAALRSTGDLELIRSPQYEDRYLIVKRVPNSGAARFALAFAIDTSLLVNAKKKFWPKKNTELVVSLPNGQPLSRTINRQPEQTLFSELFKPLTTLNTLKSRSQPLKLSSTLHATVRDFLPLSPLISGIATIGLILLIVNSILRLYSASRQAEQRAQLGEHEARISRASRINSLGELSSGIAHELTQPLTAILSQSQAGLRLLESASANENILLDILNANVTEAKRASNILARLRNWTTHKTKSDELVCANTSVKNVIMLLDAEIRRLCIKLSTELSVDDPYLLCDPVEFEQVVFNLLRNSLDKAPANDSVRLAVAINTAVVEDQVILKIKDNGVPIDDKILDRIFEPFITTRNSGMGLGLALCERIVNRMEGHIEISNAEGGVVACVGVPLHMHNKVSKPKPGDWR